MSSFWRNFHHWLHWKLSFWQLSVQPVMKISSKWRHFRFSVVAILSVYCVSVITSITIHCVTINKPEWKKYWVKLTMFMSTLSLLLRNKTVRIIHVVSPRTNADSDVLSSKCLYGYSISMFINVLIIRGYAFLTIFLFCFVFVASYMRQWAWSTSVQVMACRLFGAEPLSNQCWIIVNWTPGNKFKWNSNRYSIIFIRLPSAKRQPFCLGLNMLILQRTYWI